MSDEFRDSLTLWQNQVNEALDSLLSQQSFSSTTLPEAIRYSLVNGGKRLRPAIVYAAAHAIGKETALTQDAACAIECIHAYSLIHDDLPAMDDDDLRRGQPTCHRAFDEATAILAGDALQTLAFSCLSETKGDSAEDRLQMIRILANASGLNGMVGGQALDISAVGKPQDLSALKTLHGLKTGALISASAQLGALSTGIASPSQVEALKKYSERIGLAFQIQDDVLDVTGSTAEIGKTQGADAALNKTTYTTLMGVDEAGAEAQRLIVGAKAALDIFGESADPLRQLADFVVQRKH